MTQRQFSNVNIECWEHLADRRFGQNPPFICLKGSSEASQVVLEILDELSKAGPTNKRSLLLRGNHRPNACRKVKIILSPPSDTLKEMSITRHEDTAIFELTPDGFKRFREAVELWKNGTEDFSVHPDLRIGEDRDRQSGEVWFWTPHTDP